MKRVAHLPPAESSFWGLSNQSDHFLVELILKMISYGKYSAEFSVELSWGGKRRMLVRLSIFLRVYLVKSCTLCLTFCKIIAMQLVVWISIKPPMLDILQIQRQHCHSQRVTV